MASITKPFVATSLMQLVEKGKVDLDAPVVALPAVLSHGGRALPDHHRPPDGDPFIGHAGRRGLRMGQAAVRRRRAGALRAKPERSRRCCSRPARNSSTATWRSRSSATSSPRCPASRSTTTCRTQILTPLRHEGQHAVGQTRGCAAADMGPRARRTGPPVPEQGLPVQPDPLTELEPALERAGHGTLGDRQHESRRARWTEDSPGLDPRVDVERRDLGDERPRAPRSASAGFSANIAGRRWSAIPGATRATPRIWRCSRRKRSRSSG